MGGKTVRGKWQMTTTYFLAVALGSLMLLPPIVVLVAQAGAAFGDVIFSLLEAGGFGSCNGMMTTRSMSSFWLAGLRTLSITAISVATAMLFAIPASFVLAKTGSAAGFAGWGVVLSLAGVPTYVTVSGVVRIATLAWLIDPGSPGKTLLAVGLISGIACAPLATVAAAAAWLSIPRETEEAGLLVTRPFRTWRKITLPLGVGGLASAGALVGVLSACDMTVSDALTVRTWAEELYLAFNLELDPGKAAISALPLAMITMGGMGTLLWRVGRTAVAQATHQGRTVYRYSLGGWRVAVLGMLLISAMAMAFPLIDLLWAGLAESTKWPAWVEVCRAALVTIVCSGAGAGLALVMAFPFAWMASRWRSRLVRIVIIAGAMFFLSIPTPMFGYAMASFWNQPWWNAAALSWAPRLFYDTPLAVIALYAMQTLPLATLILWATLKQMPSTCLDAAATMSIRPFSLMIRVVLPFCRDGCLLAWAVCYLLSLRELGGLLLIAPPGWTFLAVRYATQIHFGVYADLAFLLAISLPLVLLPPLALVLHVLRRNARMHKGRTI